MKILYFTSDASYRNSMPASNIIPRLAAQRHDVLIIDKLMYKELGRKNILAKIKAFKPDLIHIFWSHYWLKMPSVLKTANIRAKLVVDFRSPILLTPPQKVARRTDIASKLNAKIHGYFSTNLSVIQDNIGIVPKYSFEYFVGINKVRRNNPIIKNKHKTTGTTRLVLVSTLEPQRNIGHLIFLCTLANLVRKQKVSLDIIGEGGNLRRLSVFAKLAKPFCEIQFLGVLDHAKVHEKIIQYDIGITHLPFRHYTDAPALKTFEYFAAGIPVIASNTNYHKKLLKEGFHLRLYNNNLVTFLHALQAKRDYFQVQNNQNMVTRYEWENLFNNIIEPAYEEIVKKAAEQRFDNANWGWRGRIYRWSCKVFCRLFRLSY